MANEEEKEAAGRAAAKLVRDGDIVGLGTGSTAYFAVVALGERVKAGTENYRNPNFRADRRPGARSRHSADHARRSSAKSTSPSMAPMKSIPS